jgi:hypothetical protein
MCFSVALILSVAGVAALWWWTGGFKNIGGGTTTTPSYVQSTGPPSSGGGGGGGGGPPSSGGGGGGGGGPPSSGGVPPSSPTFRGNYEYQSGGLDAAPSIIKAHIPDIINDDNDFARERVFNGKLNTWYSVKIKGTEKYIAMVLSDEHQDTKKWNIRDMLDKATFLYENLRQDKHREQWHNEGIFAGGSFKFALIKLRSFQNGFAWGGIDMLVNSKSDNAEYIAQGGPTTLLHEFGHMLTYTLFKEFGLNMEEDATATCQRCPEMKKGPWCTWCDNMVENSSKWVNVLYRCTGNPADPGYSCDVKRPAEYIADATVHFFCQKGREDMERLDPMGFKLLNTLFKPSNLPGYTCRG